MQTMSIKNRSIPLFVFLFTATFSMFWMSLQYFDNEPSGIVKGKEAANSLIYQAFLLTHISMGIIAMVTGPFQLMKSLRRLPIHKVLGYIYAVAIMGSGFAGLYIAPYAMGGFVSATGFSVLSMVWITTTGLGIYHILRRNPIRHRRWMLRSLACTFATITQRTLLLSAMLDSIDFMTVYQMSAWFPWMFNLLVVEIWNKNLNDAVKCRAKF